jgi:hypothetical protein
MIDFLHRIIPKRLQSGTSRCPTPVDVFNKLIDDVMMDKDELDKAYFKAKKCKGWAEVYWEKGNIIVNFKFPFADSLETIFAEKGIKKPEGWGLKFFKKKKKAVFHLSKNHKDSIAPFLDLVFKNLYDCPTNYILSGKMILGLWQMTG